MDDKVLPRDASSVAALDRFLGLDCEPERVPRGTNPELLAFMQTKRYAHEMSGKVDAMRQAWEVEFRVCNAEKDIRSTVSSITQPVVAKLQLSAEYDSIEEIPLGDSSNSEYFAPFHTKVDNFLDNDDSDDLIPSSYIPSGVNIPGACPAQDSFHLGESLWRPEDAIDDDDSRIDELESPDVSIARSLEIGGLQEDSITLDWIAEVLGNHQSRIARMGLVGLLGKSDAIVYEPPGFDSSVTDFAEY